MSVASMDTFLQQCEKLSYADCMKYMYEIGLHSRTDVSARAVVSNLHQSSSLYQQILGLQACCGSRDLTPALQGAVSRSRSLRRLSVAIISRIGSSEDVLGILSGMQRHHKAQALHVLRRQRRQSEIDSFLGQLFRDESDDELLKNQISLASGVAVEAWLPRVMEHFHPEHWTRLTRRHPKVVCRVVRSWVLSKGEITSEMHPVLDRILPEMGRPSIPRTVADMALDLVEFLQQYVPVSSLRLQPILNKRPQRVAKLILEEGRDTSLNFSHVAQELNSRELCLLFEKYPNAVSRHRFDKFSPEQRLAVYCLSSVGWQDRNGIISPSIIGRLPTIERVTEARRQLKLPYFDVWPVQQISYIACLPWEEGLPLQTLFLQSSDAEVRAAALSSQIESTRYDENHLSDALQLLIQRRFEQDPVRQQMLASLANLSPSRWKLKHLPSLAVILRDALDASDLSSARSLIKLLGKLIPIHPSWAASQVLIILRERGGELESIKGLGIGSYSEKTARIVAVSLLPYMEILQKQNNVSGLLELASIFDRNVNVFPELLDVVETMLFTNKAQAWAYRGLHILAEHSPRRFKVIIPKLIAADATFMNIDSVKSYAHRHQQYLLTPYLNQKGYEGRFSTGKLRVSLYFGDGFHRWTQTQQDIFANALMEDLNDHDRPVGELQRCIYQLSRLYFVNPAYLISFSNDARIVIRDKALRSLPMLDADQGVPTMLAALGDTRARVVIYSISGVLKGMSKAEALELLQSTPNNKVTVAKELIRLIGDLDTENSYQHLLKVATTELHPDVHIAFLRGLWAYLERSETWEIYQTAARHENPNIAKAVTNIPVNGMSKSARKAYVELFLLLLKHPQVPVRLSALEISTHLPREDSEPGLVDALLKLLPSRIGDEAAAASRALFTRYRKTQPQLIGEAFRSILPDRETLLTVAEPYIQNAPMLGRDKMLASTNAILVALRADPLSVTLRLRLAFAALPWEELKEEILSLAPDLHADAVVQTENLLAGLRWRPDARLIDLERALAGRAEESLRRLGLAVLVVQSTFPEGWTVSLRERLLVYQKDTSVLVAGAACWIFPPYQDLEDADISKRKSRVEAW